MAETNGLSNKLDTVFCNTPTRSEISLSVAMTPSPANCSKESYCRETREDMLAVLTA